MSRAFQAHSNRLRAANRCLRRLALQQQPLGNLKCRLLFHLVYNCLSASGSEFFQLPQRISYLSYQMADRL